jgi:acetylornithine/succinyldiaminopimelate/putrescine aminotransferase
MRKLLNLENISKVNFLKLRAYLKLEGEDYLESCSNKIGRKRLLIFSLGVGVEVNAPNANTIRIAPPLIVSKAECSKFVKIFSEVIANG